MHINQHLGFFEEKKKPVIFSFFSGSGFLDLGFEHTGFDIRFVNEFYKPFLEAYKFSRKKMGTFEPQYGYHQCSIDEFNEGVFKEVLKKYVEEAKSDALVGFIGGPPCPDFSTAGKNRGREGDNGRLTESYINVITTHKPDFFLIENVKGLWKTKKHREFYQEMKKKLEKSGYILTDRLSNSIEFGVPQARDRIILFGIRANLISQEEAMDIAIKFPWEKYINFDKSILFNDKIWPKETLFEENSVLTKPISIDCEMEKLTVEYWFQKNEVYTHENSIHSFIPRQALAKFQTISEGYTKGKSFKRLHRWRYSPTAAYGNNEVHLHPYKCRRLTVSEALSIQSLPKEFALPADMSLSNMFKTIGNGVPYLFSTGIALSIYDYIANLSKGD